jgi:hypothetical protein
MSDPVQRPAILSPVPVIPLHENSLFDDWLAAVEEYRNARDAEESAKEKAGSSEGVKTEPPDTA